MSAPRIPALAALLAARLVGLAAGHERVTDREATGPGRAAPRQHAPHGLVGRYVERTRQSVFYLDPHVCMRCRYRSTELLWQCPNCHDWNTFVEERIAPAQDPAELEPVKA